MRNASLWIAASALACSSIAAAETPAPAATAPSAQDLSQARELIKEFATTLQGELKSALGEGGPVKAIEICQDRAPAIAEELSERSGWKVRRVSLKPRNPTMGVPDVWEHQVLEEFDTRNAGGEDPAAIMKATVVSTDSGSMVRVMKAIPTAELCLTCHGSNLAPEVASALRERYPDDQAQGYRSGELRGAFSLSKPL